MRTLLVVAGVLAVCHSLAPTTYLNTDDVASLESLFSKHLTARKDLVSVHYAAIGLHKLKKAIPQSKDVCEFVKKSLDTSDLSSIYMAVRTASLLANCKLDLNKETLQLLDTRVTSDQSSVQDIFHAVETITTLSRPLDSTALSKRLLAALKKDESVLSLGYSFHIASHMTGDVAVFAERIEDAIIQADEIDSRYLQFDGGVGITSIILTGVYNLSEKLGSISGISGQQVVKFTNYLVNRKTVQSVKAASHLVSALAMLADNKFHVPLVISLQSHTAMTADNARVSVRVSDVMGGPVSPATLTVTADSVTRHHDDAVVVSQLAFSADPQDTSLFHMNVQPAPSSGFYTVAVSAKSAAPPPPAKNAKKKDQPAAASRYLAASAGIRVSVLAQVSVQQPKLALVDGDFSEQQLPSSAHQLKQFKQLSAPLSADLSQRLLVSFTLSHKCHQVFVRVECAAAPGGGGVRAVNSGVTMVIQPDEQLSYKLDLSFSKHVKQLSCGGGGSSSLYRAVLIVGDATIDNSFVWPLTEIKLKTDGSAASAQQDIYALKPEIKHVFREPDARPSSTVSNLFTVLVLVPSLIMLIGWLRVGISFSLSTVSLYSLGFVGGIAAIFTLYFYFWLQLNMFVTIKYLCALAVVTFLCGHKTLACLAQYRKEQRL